MAAAAILKNRHILAVVSPISTKFGTMTQLGPLGLSDPQNFPNLKIQNGGGRHLQK